MGSCPSIQNRFRKAIALVHPTQCAHMADANGMGLCHWSMVSDYLPHHENPVDPKVGIEVRRLIDL